MKVNEEFSEGISSLILIHATILQQLRIHKMTCELFGYDKFKISVIERTEIVSKNLDELILYSLRNDIFFDLQNLSNINAGQTVEEILSNDKAVFENCCELLQKLLISFGTVFDIKHILEKVYVMYYSFVCGLNQQIEIVRQIGLSLYIATRC